MRAPLVIVAWTAVFVVIGCSGAPSGDAPDFEIDRRNAESDAATGDAPEDDAGPGAKEPVVHSYRGSLAMTERVAFGGSPFCDYEVALEDVSVEVRVADGEITEATVKNRVVEFADAECPHDPMVPSDHAYALAEAIKTPSGTRLTFTGAETNRPKTELVVELAPEGQRYGAAMRWKRIDQEAPLDWTVTASLPLARN